jgi:hypothetical protein
MGLYLGNIKWESIWDHFVQGISYSLLNDVDFDLDQFIHTYYYKKEKKDLYS